MNIVNSLGYYPTILWLNTKIYKIVCNLQITSFEKIHLQLNLNLDMYVK